MGLYMLNTEWFWFCWCLMFIQISVHLLFLSDLESTRFFLKTPNPLHYDCV